MEEAGAEMEETGAEMEETGAEMDDSSDSSTVSRMSRRNLLTR
jgi:hypothetical protein